MTHLYLLVGTQEQCKKSLEHLERIIKVKADVLSKLNPKRKEPKFVFFVVSSIYQNVIISITYDLPYYITYRHYNVSLHWVLVTNHRTSQHAHRWRCPLNWLIIVGTVFGETT